MIYQILDGETVINTIVADEAFMLEHYPEGNYTQLPEPEAPVPQPPVYQWYIDIGPFFDRFGAAKMAVLTSTDSGVKALITDIQIRKWIDLKLPEVDQALAYLGSVIPAVTTELQSAILETPVAEHENLALRKLYFT